LTLKIPGLVYAPQSPLTPILDNITRVAASRANVLVTGESGSGKEGISRALHGLAPWKDRPFVPTNCGAIPDALLESELFGHVKGAFTGADRPRIGRFEAAQDGTLFLDEIGEMPLNLQVKMLRVLQEREFEPVGSSTRKKARFRLVAATNRDLKTEVEEERFRQDLFFRLDVVRIHVPSLRERVVDIPLLAEHFIAKYAKLNNSTVDSITSDAVRLLKRYEWPGNIRELENVIQGILVFKPEGRIEADDIAMRLHVPDAEAEPTIPSEGMDLPDDGLDLRSTLEDVERTLIRAALKRTDGNKTLAANLLRLKRTTLVEKLKRMDPDTPS
jgi:transcriptional regulator with PAS, ATPase and Fis domain